MAKDKENKTPFNVNKFPVKHESIEGNPSKRGDAWSQPVKKKGPQRGTIREFIPQFADASDAQANAGFTVSFEHVPSSTKVNFKAFITAFNETFNVDWAAETVYGRADPIYMFKNTGRDITLALNLPAATIGEAYENLNKLQKLTRFLYPTYDQYGKGGDVNALTITNSPLVRLKVMNILSDRKGGNQATTINNYFSNGAANAPAPGILGVIKNLSINHNLDNPDHGVFQAEGGVILPKMIEINLSFGVIHEHTVGWTRDGDGQKFANENFPYGINDKRPGAEYKNMQDTYASNAKETVDRNDVLDKLQAKAVENEQTKMQEKAKYAGMFGGVRKWKDSRRARRQADSAQNTIASPDPYTSDDTGSPAEPDVAGETAANEMVN